MPMPLLRTASPYLAVLVAAVLATGHALVPVPVMAQTQDAPATEARLAPLLEALALDEVVGIMQAEGMDYAGSLDSDLLGGRGGAAWMREARRIYDPVRMRAAVVAQLDAQLPDDPEALARMQDFFGSERGRRIVALENGARRAMLDPEVDATARAGAAALVAEGGPLLALLEEFLSANDLVDSNVEGGMNANFAFYLGLRETGPSAFDIPDSEMVADVWAQEDVIRTDTRAWLLAYLGLAYRPLQEDDLRAYIAFSLSPDGRALNRAMFGAFNEVFAQISHELGRAAGRVLREQDI